MPQTTSSASENPLNVHGPCKCHPTERVLDNGDPLVQKKKKKANTAINAVSYSGTQTSLNNLLAIKSSLTRRASVEDITEPARPSRTQPHNPNSILEAADGSDNDAYIGMPALAAIDSRDDDIIDMPALADVSNDEDSDDEDSDDEDADDEKPEDDEAELRRFQFASIHIRLTSCHRSSDEEMGRICLRFFQTYPHY